MKGRGTVYLSPTGGSLAPSGTCLGPKGPGCNDQINPSLARLHRDVDRQRKSD